jgi:uncharacterized protein
MSALPPYLPPKNNHAKVYIVALSKKSMVKRKKVLLDTNFLLIPSQFNVDIFTELERVCIFPFDVYIIDKSLNELEKVKEEQKGKDKEAARLALDLVKAKHINTLPTAGSKRVDELLVDLASQEVIVATQDKEVKKRLKHKGVPHIILRQQQYLVLE